MNSDDRDRKRAWKAEQRAAAQARFPLPDAELEGLFDAVEAKLGESECDHTRRFTEAWLRARCPDADSVLAWLDDTGGACDCEVIANSREAWEENRRV